MDTRYLSTNGIIKKITDPEEMRKILEFIPQGQFNRAEYLDKSPIDYSFNELYDILQIYGSIVFSSLIQKPYALLSAANGCAVVAFSMVIGSPDEFIDKLFAFQTAGKRANFCRLRNYYGGPENTKILLKDFSKLSGMIRKPDVFRQLAIKILPIVF